MTDKTVILNELGAFISFPSVGSNPESKDAMTGCAEWLRQQLVSIGMQKTSVFKTELNPVVYAEYMANPGARTILFYGHYDVQPVDPLSEWLSPPLKMKIDGEYMYGRGVSDDKGQLFVHIKAVEKMLKKQMLNVNVKFLIEGAEESGSIGLKDFIRLNKQMLHCDVAVVSDTKMVSENVPAITYSLRGSLNAEIIVKTSSRDLHSGTFGGAVPNAILVLSNIISELHHSDGTIAVPGFYNEVQELALVEKAFMKANSASSCSLLKDAGVLSGWGEKNYSLQERTTIRPSIAVTGISGGFQGQGFKNVIPSTASAKINCRLAPIQQPEKIKILLNSFLKQILPLYVKGRVRYSGLSNPVVVSKNNVYIKAAIKAYEVVFKTKPRLIRSGGTIAAVDYLHHILAVPVVLMGFAQASDNMHAPNERMYLPNFFRGIDTSMNFLEQVGLLNNAKQKSYAHH